MSVIRDLLGHHSVTLTEKYYAHLAPSNLSSAVKRLEIGEGEKSPVPKTVPSCTKNGISDSENPDDALLLTDSFERCYVPEVALLAGVAKLAYAADSKSAGVHSPWGFKSLLRHATTILITISYIRHLSLCVPSVLPVRLNVLCWRNACQFPGPVGKLITSHFWSPIYSLSVFSKKICQRIFSEAGCQSTLAVIQTCSAPPSTVLLRLGFLEVRKQRPQYL